MIAIDLSAAQERTWDVILVGSSFAACFFARALKGRALSVLFVERGPFIDYETQLATRHDEVSPIVPQENSSGRQKDWAIRYQFGGCSNCWWGNTPRLHPSDFKLKTLYGVANDWPISYEALDPYLVEAEDLMDIAGGGGEAFLPRSRPYPFPPHVPTRAERRLMEHDKSWIAMPTARSNGGKRASCCASGACSLCPIDAKFTILNGLDNFYDENFAFTTGAECRMVTTAAGLATGIVVQDHAKRETTLRGDFVGLAANPIGNSTILLRSGIGGELVGKGLHEQLGQYLWLNIPFDNYYGGSSITGIGYAFYDGPFRSEAASVLIESWNAPPSLRLEPGKWLQQLKLKLVAEDLPLSANRVVLERDEAKIIWTGHSDYAYAGLTRAREELPGILPFDHEVTATRFEPTEAHIIGGTPMGTNPENGVVDRDCRLFNIPNVACLGASSFPTGSAANPTLTISALSLYLGGRL